MRQPISILFLPEIGFPANFSVLRTDPEPTPLTVKRSEESERGCKVPTIDVLLRLARALGVRVRDLVADM